jgi:hypothetical protein
MNQVQETLDAIKGAHKTPLGDDITKSYTMATGLTAYDLEPAAKLLFPALTPLRNRLPRVLGKGGNATNWQAITAINPNNVAAGVAEGRRGGIISVTKQNYLAAYKGIGLEDDVTFEADYAGEGFENVKALAVENLLKSFMISEERMILGGNGSAVNLTITPTPTLVAANIAGSTLPAVGHSVVCVALSYDGWRRASLATGVQQTISRTNADGSTDVLNGGSAQRSAAVVVNVAAGQGILASVADVNGAMAYAWYVGAAGAETLQAITTVSAATFSTPLVAGRQNVNAIVADRSMDPLAFDGLLYQAFRPGSGAQIMNLATPNGAGTSLTSDGAGGVDQIENMLTQFWDNLRCGPTEMHMSARTRKVVSNLIVRNNNGAAVTPLLQIITDTRDRGQHIGATQVTKYLNKITGQEIDMSIHPDMPDGTILFYTGSVPYALSGVGNICQIKTRRDYYQIEWPLRTRRYEFGVYADEVLQHYFPPSLGVMRNIATP